MKCENCGIGIDRGDSAYGRNGKPGGVSFFCSEFCMKQYNKGIAPPPSQLDRIEAKLDSLIQSQLSMVLRPRE